MRRDRTDIVMVNGIPVEVANAEDTMIPQPMSDREVDRMLRRMMGRYY